MFERFADESRRVLAVAGREARRMQHNFVGTEHILLGVLADSEGVAAKALESLGVSVEAVREEVEQAVGPAGIAPTANPPFTPRAKKVLEFALREAQQSGHNFIGTDHLLLAIGREGRGTAAQILVKLGVDLSRMRPRLLSGMAATAPAAWAVVVMDDDGDSQKPTHVVGPFESAESANAWSSAQPESATQRHKVVRFASPGDPPTP